MPKNIQNDTNDNFIDFEFKNRNETGKWCQSCINNSFVDEQRRSDQRSVVIRTRECRANVAWMVRQCERMPPPRIVQESHRTSKQGINFYYTVSIS